MSVEWIDRLAGDDYLIIDHFLSADILEELQRFFNQKLSEDALKKAGIGAQGLHQIADDIRGDFIYWLEKDRDIALQPVFQLLDKWKEQLNELCFLSISSYEFHLALYPVASFYKRHLDQFNTRNNRLISIVIYLNSEWKKGDGGELVIYKDQKEIIVEPIAGKCVVFRSDLIEHEVLPANKPRKSLTGWMLYQPPVLGQLFG